MDRQTLLSIIVLRCQRQPDFPIAVEEFDEILQRVEPLDHQTNDSPERPVLSAERLAVMLRSK